MPKTQKRQELDKEAPEANPIDDPQHWRERAAEARTLAELMTDSDARQKMLGVAEGYDQLAKGAEQRLRPN